MRARLRRLRRHGFSLVELGIVIAVIAVLAAVVIGSAGYFKAAKERMAIDTMLNIRKASSAFSMRLNRGLNYGISGSQSEPKNVTLEHLIARNFLPAGVKTPWGDPAIVVTPWAGPPNANCADYTCIKIDMPVPAEECVDGANAWLVTNIQDQAVPGGATCNATTFSVIFR